MSRIIGLGIRLLGHIVAGSVAALIGFGMGGPFGAASLLAVGGFIGFFVVPLFWHRITTSNGGQ